MPYHRTRLSRFVTLAVLLLAMSPWAIAREPTTIKAAQKNAGKYVNWQIKDPTDTTWVRLKFFARRIKSSIMGRDGSPPSRVENDATKLRSSHSALA